MMSDPNTYPQFPGFPQPSSAHAQPPHIVDPSAGRLHPAVSQADQDRGAGAANRQAFGPPAGGWPGMGPIMPSQWSMPGSSPPRAPLSPIKERLVAGVQRIAETYGGNFGPTFGMAMGAATALLQSRIADIPDEAVAAELERFERLTHEWRTGEDIPAESPDERG